MSLFPTRDSNASFLRTYEQLAGGDDDDGDDCIDLGEESAGEDDHDTDGEDLPGLIADERKQTAEEAETEERKHKELDAALRDREREQLEALAARFEAQATDYLAPEGHGVRKRRRHGSDDVKGELQRRDEARDRALARRAQAEADWRAAEEAAEAAARAEAETKAAAKKDALYALYDLYDEM